MRRSILRLLWCLGSLIAGASIVAGEEISGELVGLPVSLAHEKQLVVFDQLVAAEQWQSALEILDRLPEVPPSPLVRVTPGRYVNATAAIQKRLIALPPAGREVIQRLYHVNATTLLNRAKLNQDEASLWKIVDEFAATPSAPLAIDELARRAAMRGDLGLALRLWRRLQPVGQSSLVQTPAAVYSIASGDTALIDATRDKISTTIELIDLGDSNRKEMGEEEGPGPAAWTTLATANSPLGQHQAPISVTPAERQTMIINNGEMIRAVHAADGAPRWPSGTPDDVGVLFDESDELVQPLPDVPHRLGGGAATADRYFGVLGDAPRWRPRPGLVPLGGHLVSLDLGTSEGRTVWRIDSRDLPEAEWLFHGGPVLVPGSSTSDDLVVVPMCRPGAQVELAVAAFRQDDGERVWWSRIGVCAGEAGVPIPPTQLIADSGLIVARTLTGVIVTLDSRLGRIDWASTSMVSSPPESTTSHAPLLATHRGVLVAVDPLMSQVAAYSLDGGDGLWRTELSDALSGVVCGPGDRILVAGKRLHALSLTDGRLLWQQGGDDPIVAGTGVPWVIRQTVLWPTRQGVQGVDLRSGDMLFFRRLFAEPVALPMCLVATDSRWTLSCPEAVFSLTRRTEPAP